MNLRATLIAIALQTSLLFGGTIENYLHWKRETVHETAPEVNYVDHHRQAFAAGNQRISLTFNLSSRPIGLASLGTDGDSRTLIQPGSLNLILTDSRNKVYQTKLSTSPARINVFRHGPHYIDLRVFDLIPTAEDEEQLPVKGELAFHIWPRRCYVEAKLHPVEPTQLAQARLSYVTEESSSGLIAGGKPAATDQIIQAPLPTDWIAAKTQDHFLLLATPAPQGTSSISVASNNDEIILNQAFKLPREILVPGQPISVAHRLYAGAINEFATAVLSTAQEATPLTEEQFTVSRNAQFFGYDARKGFYTIGTARSESLRWLYEHPETISTASVKLTNDTQQRIIAIRHQNTTRGGRLGAGILTDPDNRPLPILLQNSKNFSGENEEPFYDPGDPEYNESYFILPLRANETLRFQSHQTFQGWGNHPIKQVGSLQAWMHYYQMSLGVTETTCHVPFRFGGHPGIWIADLRGISGRMWPGRGQPQFDNVGGHRIFHYRDERGEHFPIYKRSDFKSTGPNIADWSMNFVTESNTARITFNIFEPPQTDVTRCFTKMRVEFDKPLTINNTRENLKLLSLDTSQQRLRYAALGYTDTTGVWQELDPNTSKTPFIAPLDSKAPLVAFYKNRDDTFQEGNNAILVQNFSGTLQGSPLTQLAIGLDRRRGAERITWLAPDVDRAAFQPGDYLELDFVVIPFGRKGDGPDEAQAERQRYGLNPPTITAIQGTVLNSFPARIKVSLQGTAEFTISGGHSEMPIYLEGFDSITPPLLQSEGPDGSWMTIEMGNEGLGHQSYPADDGSFGFVFLVNSDGSSIRLKCAPR